MQPHLLVITIDTLRADYVNCYGRREIATPNLDRFAASGARFGEHLSSISVTLPSHCALMTGCTPMVNGVTWNGMDTSRRRRTLAEIAAEAGYQTTAITSWGGFQTQAVYGYQNVYSQEGAASLENRGDKTIQRVQQWIEQADSTIPQLLWVHFIDPHTPDHSPAPFPHTYEGSIEFTDTLIGPFIEAWDSRFGADKSIAVITADHGEHINDHGVERSHGSLWETCLWIPLMMRVPDMIKPGSVVPELTRQIDVLPTILDYAQLPMPYDVEGMSMRGLIEGTDSNMRLVHQGQAINTEAYTATIRNAEYSLHFGEEQNLAYLFDRRTDPGEEQSLLDTGALVNHSTKHSIADAKEK